MQEFELLRDQFSANGERSLVYIVDDDELTRKSICSLLRSIDLDVKSFGTAREFISCEKPSVPACLILDVRLGGESGLDLQQHLLNSGIKIGIIFMSAYGDIPTTVQAMKSG